MFAVWVKGDALDKDSVERCFKQIDGLDAVVTSIGRAPGESADADSLGNINIIEAAARHGVKKFILVTSIGTAESKAGTPPNVYEALKPVLVEKEKAERRLMEVARQHGMDFVIIRRGRGVASPPAAGLPSRSRTAAEADVFPTAAGLGVCSRPLPPALRCSPRTSRYAGPSPGRTSQRW